VEIGAVARPLLSEGENHDALRSTRHRLQTGWNTYLRVQYRQDDGTRPGSAVVLSEFRLRPTKPACEVVK